MFRYFGKEETYLCTGKSDYSFVKDENFRVFLQANTLDTIFDIEEEPTEFKQMQFASDYYTYHNYSQRIIIFEFDSRMTENISNDLRQLVDASTYRFD